MLLNLSFRGTDSCWCSLLPQHSADPSSFIPQEWSLPPLTVTKDFPLGGEACPWSFLPQQMIARSSRSAQVWLNPLLASE